MAKGFLLQSNMPWLDLESFENWLNLQVRAPQEEEEEQEEQVVELEQPNKLQSPWMNWQSPQSYSKR